MISCFGASVTQQKNGYVDFLSDLVNDRIIKFGFGGMHLKDAGICFVDKVISIKPNVCIINWFSTDYKNEDGCVIEYIKMLIEKFNKINTRVIFLFLPNRNSYDWYSFYLFLKQKLKVLNLEYIPIDELLKNFDINLLLRDTIHIKLLDKAKIEILQCSFDTSKCKKNINFNNLKKMIYLDSIFYNRE